MVGQVVHVSPPMHYVVEDLVPAADERALRFACHEPGSHGLPTIHADSVVRVVEANVPVPHIRKSLPRQLVQAGHQDYRYVYVNAAVELQDGQPGRVCLVRW